MPEEKDPSIIIDASSLIALFKLDLIEILRDLYASVYAPEGVLYEFAQDLPQWIQILPPGNNPLVTVLSKKLGNGEAEAIAMGVERDDCIVVLDDLKARQTAKKLGLKITGLLGILLKAKKRKIISEIKPLLIKLERENFRISVKLKNEVLKSAGENNS